MKKIIVYTFLAVSTIACKNSDKKQEAIETNNQDQENTVQTQQEEGDWQYLFNGSRLEGWRGYGEEEMPPDWIIEDNVLTYKTDLGKEEDYTGGRDIIYGAEEFDNFELSLEWKLPEGGNSGIFYHVKEGYENPSKVAPEYQLIDDENYENIHDLTGYNESLGHTENLSELKPLNKTAADYAMYAPDSEKKKWAMNPRRSRGIIKMTAPYHDSRDKMPVKHSHNHLKAFLWEALASRDFIYKRPSFR